MNTHQSNFRKKVALSLFFVVTVLTMLGAVSVTGVFAQTNTNAAATTPEQADIAKFGLIAAAIAFGFGAIGAGIAIANVGAAAMGAIGEKPEIASQALIFIALAEGLVVFGFITALMILGKF
jgi:V/A-type H+/Na+-transporting ATPase subunit K